MEDPAFVAEYEAQRSEYEAIRAVTLRGLPVI